MNSRSSARFVQHHVQQTQRERRIGPRHQRQVLVRSRRSPRANRIDGDDASAVPSSRENRSPQMRMRREHIARPTAESGSTAGASPDPSRPGCRRACSRFRIRRRSCTCSARASTRRARSRNDGRRRRRRGSAPCCRCRGTARWLHRRARRSSRSGSPRSARGPRPMKSGRTDRCPSDRCVASGAAAGSGSAYRRCSRQPCCRVPRAYRDDRHRRAGTRLPRS